VTRPAPAGRGTPEGLVRRAAVVAALSLATLLFGGYQFARWPQLFPLEHVLRLRGGLANDWYTAHPAPHWVFDHALALLPAAALEPACAALWVAGLALFWAAFAALAADRGASEAGILAVGLIGARSAFPGFGSTTLLTPYLYPSSLACAVWLLALRAALRGRETTSGIATGLALLLHPQLGVLALATVAAPLAMTAGPRRALKATGLALLVGGAALVRLVADLRWHETLPAAERLALLAFVRLPHHLVFGAFPIAEVAAVGLWAAVLLVASGMLERDRDLPPATLAGWRALLVTIAALLAAGAVASTLGRPLALIELQTARASAWIPLLAPVAAAAVVNRRAGPLAVPALFAVPLAAAILDRIFDAAWPGAVRPGAVAALVLLVLFALLPVLHRRRVELVPRARVAVAAGLVALGLLASGWRGPPRVPDDSDWLDIAARGAQASRPGDVFLTPPDLDGFRWWSDRAIVVDFGEIAHADLTGWRERLAAVCGGAGVLAPLPLRTTVERERALGRAYDLYLPRARGVARRYGARFVVARRAAPAPGWATPVTANATYELYRVADGGTP